MVSCARATRTIQRMLVGHAQWETNRATLYKGQTCYSLVKMIAKEEWIGPIEVTNETGWTVPHCLRSQPRECHRFG